MIKHTQAVRRLLADELFYVLYHFVGLAVKEVSIGKILFQQIVKFKNYRQNK